MPLTDAQIRQRYRDPRQGLKGLAAFAKELRREHPDVSAAQVRRALMAEESFALNARRVNPPERRRVVVRGLDDTWTCDLADVSNVSTENNGVKYLLVVVDILSGYLWVEPCHGKSPLHTMPAFRRILERAAPRKPRFLWTDDGSEFKGAFDRLCREQGIQRYVTGGEGKAVVAERMIRTLRGRLGRLAESRGTWKFIDVLQDIVANINNTVSRPIGMAPAKVTPANAAEVARRRYKDIDAPDAKTLDKAARLEARPKYAVGDLVRVSALKGVFQKEGTANSWTHELFRVTGVTPGNPALYQLADIDPRSGDALLPGEAIKGDFYETELAEAVPPAQWRVEVKERLPRGRVRVGYVGWPAKYDRIVPAREVQDVPAP